MYFISKIGQEEHNIYLFDFGMVLLTSTLFLKFEDLCILTVRLETLKTIGIADFYITKFLNHLCCIFNAKRVAKMIGKVGLIRLLPAINMQLFRVLFPANRKPQSPNFYKKLYWSNWEGQNRKK